MSRNACIWCGLHEIRDMEGEVYFACGSSCYSVSGVWEQSTGCGEILDLRQRIADDEQTIEILKAREANTVEALRGYIEDLQRRIADALAELTAIERHEAGSDVGFEQISKHGEWVLFEDLRPVQDILTGNSPKESEDEQ